MNIITDSHKVDLLNRYLSLSESQRDHEFPTTRRAEELTGVSRRTIQYWIDIGEVEAIFVGRRYRVYFASLKSYLQSRVYGPSHYLMHRPPFTIKGREIRGWRLDTGESWRSQAGGGKMDKRLLILTHYHEGSDFLSLFPATSLIAGAIGVTQTIHAVCAVRARRL
jgi:excisionase family DNA binding protein